jgi:two-component system, cell cycle response regulator
MQDIGVTVLGAAFGERYARLVSHARSCGPAHLHVVEREDLRIEHSEISAALLEQWGFPEEFVSAIRCHHSSNAGGTDDRQCSSFINAMRIAECVADLCDNRHATRRQEFQRQLAASCQSRPEQGLSTLDESAGLIAEITQQFRVPLADEGALRSLFRDLRESDPEVR